MDWYVLLRKLLPIIDLILILYISLRKNIRASIQTFWTAFLIIYSVHFFLATTVHPWYITPLVMLAVLSSYRMYVLIWTALIGLTYISYQHEIFAENSWAIGLEYALVFVVLVGELRQKKKNTLT